MEDKLKAYLEIKEMMESRSGSEEEKMQELLAELKAKKKRMQEDMARNLTVQLHKRQF